MILVHEFLDECRFVNNGLNEIMVVSVIIVKNYDNGNDLAKSYVKY